MAEQETTENPNMKRIKQTISIPFLWEEKPGTPKTDWKHVNPIMQLPVKLIAMVQFQWEEKPGTPIVRSSFSSSSSLPPHLIKKLERTNPFYDSECVLEEQYDPDEDLEQSELGIMNSSDNIPNCLIKYHKSNNPFCDSDSELEELDNGDDNGYLQAPSSPAWETESNTSSYATGTTTLAGSSFLECMFPLLAPKTSFFGNTGCSVHRVSSHSTKDFDFRTVSNGAGRKTLTLGELILMSRRRNYIRKAVESQEHNFSTELMRRNAFGCCIGVDGLQKWKRQLQLKLI